MKQEIKVKNNEVKTREETVGILAMWKAFWNPEEKEESEIETIMKDESLSKEMKELLIKSLKNADRIMKPTGGSSSRNTTRLKVDAKQNEKNARENSVQIDTKSKIVNEKDKEIGE